MTLTARLATVADAEEIARIYNQGIEDRTSTFVTRASNASDVRGWFSGGMPIVVVEGDDGTVGFAASSRWRQSGWFEGIAELSVYVEREQRGRGIGRIALSALVRAAEQAGLRKLIGGIFSGNRASRTLFLRAGFREVGVFEKQAQLDGVWHDVLIVEKLIAQPP